MDLVRSLRSLALEYLASYHSERSRFGQNIALFHKAKGRPAQDDADSDIALVQRDILNCPTPMNGGLSSIRRVKNKPHTLPIDRNVGLSVPVIVPRHWYILTQSSPA